MFQGRANGLTTSIFRVGTSAESTTTLSDCFSDLPSISPAYIYMWVNSSGMQWCGVFVVGANWNCDLRGWVSTKWALLDWAENVAAPPTSIVERRSTARRHPSCHDLFQGSSLNSNLVAPFSGDSLLAGDDPIEHGLPTYSNGNQVMHTSFN